MTNMTHHIRYYKVLIEFLNLLFGVQWKCVLRDKMLLNKSILFAAGLYLTFAFGMLQLIILYMSGYFFLFL